MGLPKSLSYGAPHGAPLLYFECLGLDKTILAWQPLICTQLFVFASEEWKDFGTRLRNPKWSGMIKNWKLQENTKEQEAVESLYPKRL